MAPVDLVVVLPGIMGSTLSRNGTVVWAPSAGSVLRAVLTFGASVTDLRLPEGVGDHHPGDGVEPVNLMPDVHVIPGLWTPTKGYTTLLRRLRRLGLTDVTDDYDAPAGNLLPIPYDWRLSQRFNGQRIAGMIEPALRRLRARGGPFSEAKVVFVCHSMGGQIARWYIEHCGGAEHTRKLIMLGTPHRGAIRALVKLTQNSPWFLGGLGDRIDEFARSLPGLYHLLPAYACMDNKGDLQTLIEAGPIAGLNSTMLADAMRLHDQLRTAEERRPASRDCSHVILGVRQPTSTTARLTADGVVVPLHTYQGNDLAGDGTVPIVGGTPAGLPLDTNIVRRIADKHGNLQCNAAALDEVESIILGQPIVPRDTAYPVRVSVPELVRVGETIRVEITLTDRHAVRVTVIDENGELIESRVPRLSPDHVAVTEFTDLAPGAYTIDVTGTTPASPVTPVSNDILVWPDDQ